MAHTDESISRRRALISGTGIAGGLIVAASPLLEVSKGVAASTTHGGIDVTARAASTEQLPVKAIEGIMQTTGMVMNGVLTIELDRTDLHVVGPRGLPWKPAFELTHTFYFQPLSNGRAILNAEMSFLAAETNPAIDRIVASGLTLMSFHQHFFNEKPQIWHMHFRGIGAPLTLAREAINVVRATGTPLPQSQPSNPTTPLPASALARILGGMAAVGGDGVVTVTVPRSDTIVLGGVVMQPEAGVSTTIAFEPLGAGQAVCAPDLGLLANEVDPTLKATRSAGFEVHCLYNQETDEQPQLYYAHHLATGDAVDLAHRLVNALDQMNLDRS